MPTRGGIKEAAKLLSGLEYNNRIKVLEIISKQDPVIANLLLKNMVTLDDLLALTPKMILEFVHEITPKVVGLSLRIASEQIKNHILSQLPKILRQEVEEILKGPPQMLSVVQENVDKLTEHLRVKAERGEVKLGRNSNNDEYV